MTEPPASRQIFRTSPAGMSGYARLGKVSPNDAPLSRKRRRLPICGDASLFALVLRSLEPQDLPHRLPSPCTGGQAPKRCRQHLHQGGTVSSALRTSSESLVPAFPCSASRPPSLVLLSVSCSRGTGPLPRLGYLSSRGEQRRALISAQDRCHAGGRGAGRPFSLPTHNAPEGYGQGRNLGLSASSESE